MQGKLVLTRKLNERILIGDNVEVQIVGIAGGKVRVMVTAPMDLKVMRAEVVKNDCDKTNRD